MPLSSAAASGMMASGIRMGLQPDNTAVAGRCPWMAATPWMTRPVVGVFSGEGVLAYIWYTSITVAVAADDEYWHRFGMLALLWWR